FAVDAPAQPLDLALAEQELAGPLGRVVEAVGRLVFRDIGVDEVELTLLLRGEGFGDAGAPPAQRLHLAADEHQPRLQRLLDEVVEPGLAVLGDVLGFLGHGGRFLAQFASPAAASARCTFCLLASAISQSGRRRSAWQWPSRLAAYFTGPGLDSQNIASCSGVSRSLIAIAVLTSPLRQAPCISDSARGATLALTEMQPSPLWARKAITVASSPESMQNSLGIASLVRTGRARSLVASLTPTMFGSLARRAMVSTDMSTTLRPGML